MRTAPPAGQRTTAVSAATASASPKCSTSSDCPRYPLPPQSTSRHCGARSDPSAPRGVTVAEAPIASRTRPSPATRSRSHERSLPSLFM